MTVEKTLVEVCLVINPVQTAGIQKMKVVEVTRDVGECHLLKCPPLTDFPAILTLQLVV